VIEVTPNKLSWHMMTAWERQGAKRKKEKKLMPNLGNSGWRKTTTLSMEKCAEEQ